MNILVIGNCQAHQIVLCLNIINPQSRSAWFWPHEFDSRFGSNDEALEFVSGFDAVVGQDFAARRVNLSDVKAASRLFVQYPNVQFSAYHPDCVYAIHVGSEGYPSIQSPIGDYSSAIAIFGYKSGYTSEQTQKFYNGKVYERLGYFDLWAPAKQELRDLFIKADFEFEGPFAGWHRAGPFMHSMNHPRLAVGETIASVVAHKIGLSPTARICSNYMCDPNIFGAIWPIYPEIADYLSVSQHGDYTFKKAGNLLSDAPNSLLFDLTEFVNGTFARLSGIPPASIICPRVDAWLENAELTGFLERIARS